MADEAAGAEAPSVADAVVRHAPFHAALELGQRLRSHGIDGCGCGRLAMYVKTGLTPIAALAGLARPVMASGSLQAASPCLVCSETKSAPNGSFRRRNIGHEEHGGNMSKGFIREFFVDTGREILGDARNGVNDRLDDARADGFEAAASVCLGVLSKSIDGLLNQIKSGQYLTAQEQFLLSTLSELKSETEKDLRSSWEITDAQPAH